MEATELLRQLGGLSEDSTLRMEVFDDRSGGWVSAAVQVLSEDSAGNPAFSGLFSGYWPEGPVAMCEDGGEEPGWQETGDRGMSVGGARTLVRAASGEVRMEVFDDDRDGWVSIAITGIGMDMNGNPVLSGEHDGQHPANGIPMTDERED